MSKDAGPCASCAERATCKEICEELERCLPSMDAGAYVGSRHVIPFTDLREDFDPNGLAEEDRLVAPVSPVEESEWAAALPPRQAEAAHLVWTRDMTQEEAAELMRCTQPVVWELLAGARKNLTKRANHPIK